MNKVSSLTLGFALIIPFFSHTINRPLLKRTDNVLSILEQTGFWKTGNPLRLHLGCGGCHFNGYVNIDFPPSEHTVQANSNVDAYADLRTLHFPDQTIDEVRNHHVFEHFDRQTALALLCKWHQWLKIGGSLTIETPDFEASIKMLLDSRYNYLQKQSIMRHVWGSHEASWAIHCDGWYKEKFEHVLKALGFENIRFEFTQWRLTCNIIVRATKNKHFDAQTLAVISKTILRESMVDNADSEETMWRVWCKQFDKVNNN